MAANNERICPGCGRPVIRIRTMTGRTDVDAEPVWIRKESGGDSFILENGLFVFGRQTGDADDDPEAEILEAYAPHRGHCPNNGKKPRSRRRPSGYR